VDKLNAVVSGIHPAGHAMTVDFPPGLAERHATALDCVRECVYTSRQPQKAIAANMDLSPSELSRKLSHNPDDPRRFTRTEENQSDPDQKPIHRRRIEGG